MKKMIVWIALPALLLCALTGCGDATAGAATEPPQETVVPQISEPESGETGGAASSSTGEALTEQEKNYEMFLPDFDVGYAKYAPNTRVMTVNGIEYDWSSYFNALWQNIYALSLYYGVTDLSTPWGGYPVAGDAARDQAALQIETYGMIYSKAKELGIELDAAAVDNEVETIMRYYDGDRDAMFESLGVSEEYYRLRVGANLLYTKLFEYFFGEDGALLPEEDAVAYVSDNDIYYAKHILFKTLDDTGTSLGEEAVAASKTRAEETLAALRAVGAAELPAKFDELMNSLSEDPGLKNYPDGYFFTEGEMVEEFFEAASALEEGELSDVVRGPYGYHIVYRPALRADAIFGVNSFGQPYTLRYHVADELFSAMQDEWFDALNVTFEGNFETLDVVRLFEE